MCVCGSLPGKVRQIYSSFKTHIKPGMRPWKTRNIWVFPALFSDHAGGAEIAGKLEKQENKGWVCAGISGKQRSPLEEEEDGAEC